MSEMKLWFLKRGYPENIAEQQLGKFEYSKLPWRSNKKDKSVCIVVTYHLLLQNIGRCIELHYTGQEIETVFTPWLHLLVKKKLAVI